MTLMTSRDVDDDGRLRVYILRSQWWRRWWSRRRGIFTSSWRPGCSLVHASHLEEREYTPRLQPDPCLFRTRNWRVNCTSRCIYKNNKPVVKAMFESVKSMACMESVVWICEVDGMHGEHRHSLMSCSQCKQPIDCKYKRLLVWQNIINRTSDVSFLFMFLRVCLLSLKAVCVYFVCVSSSLLAVPCHAMSCEDCLVYSHRRESCLTVVLTSFVFLLCIELQVKLNLNRGVCITN